MTSTMKMPSRVHMALTLAGLSLLASGCTTSGKELAARARIPRAQAEQTALAAVPGGKITEGELEREHGKLIWSFDIATAGSKDITEIQVDAVTGRIVARETETPKQQAAEAKGK